MNAAFLAFLGAFLSAVWIIWMAEATLRMDLRMWDVLCGIGACWGVYDLTVRAVRTTYRIWSE